MRKPELVSKPVVREAPAEYDAADKQHDAAEKLSSSTATAEPTRGVTIEYQRAQAKAMQQYFRELNAQKAAEKAQVFGWTKKNEIGNGRWVMFGFAVGLLTEYATGVDFIDQLKMIVSFLGIADLE
ncbi:hypothetical protein WJX81_003407 [Elliptochloris bilobata]|uniref:High light inducible protein n=1 Tax=Elliptochloris bilobata TaxID=381761 RepID=A0AAW1RRP2_9CHLO